MSEEITDVTQNDDDDDLWEVNFAEYVLLPAQTVIDMCADAVMSKKIVELPTRQVFGDPDETTRRVKVYVFFDSVCLPGIDWLFSGKMVVHDGKEEVRCEILVALDGRVVMFLNEDDVWNLLDGELGHYRT